MTDSTQFARLIPLGMPMALILLGATGCETNQQWYRSEPEVALTPTTVVPASFLYTDFEALNNWLDERFEVEYRNMTPSLIFEQQPISDIHYDTLNLPPESERFELKSSNISRREILYRVAQHWALMMSIEEKDGVPKIVRVVGEGDKITNEANFPPEAATDVPGGDGF